MNLRATILIFAVLSAIASAGERPYGIAERVPWTTSRVAGSPEPPPPYETQRIFPKLTFDRPVDITFAPGSNRVFVVQEKGKIFSFPNDPDVARFDPFFDPKDLQNMDKMPNKGIENVFALTFHPQFEKNRYCYIQYNLLPPVRQRNFKNGGRVSRFTVAETDPPRVDPKSETILFEFLSGGHNGSTLKFGPDGYLYISLGDGADPYPPDDLKTGQDISDLLSSILRIDVDQPSADKPYSIPKDNPFIDTPNARPEVYAYGFRNPFRMSFDSKTGNLWVGDVGWELWEMVYNVKSGGNYGWSIMEGPNPIHPDGKRGPTEISKPQASISHAESASVTGGIVYRGKKLPELYGHYVFGDWQTSRIWAAKCTTKNEDTLEPFREIAQTSHRLVCFLEDPDHELLILDHGAGGIYRLVPSPAAAQPTKFPRKLSETGIFTSVTDQAPASGVLPFSVNAPQWLDGASAERWIATPGTSKVQWGKGVWGDDKPSWPKGSVLVRTLSLPMKTGDPSSSKRVETQLLHFDGRNWQGYSYAWNDDQSDAELIGAGGDDKAFTIQDSSAPGGSRRQTWNFPSRTQCMTCHNVWCDYTLGFAHSQLEHTQKFRKADGNFVEDNAARTFRHIGLLLDPRTENPPKPRPGQAPLPPPENPSLCNPFDTNADLNERARSYLHINCSHCHRNGGGGTAAIDVRKEMRASDMRAINQRPLLGDFGLDNAKLIAPGDPSRSVLLYRAAKVGRGRMPHLGSDVVDEKGVELLRQWIVSLNKPKQEIVAVQERADCMDALKVLESPAATPDSRGAALDKLLSSTCGAMDLLGAIQSGKFPDAIRQAALDKAIAAPNEPVRDLFRRFDPREQFAVRLGAHFDPAKLLAKTGDAARGRKIFFEASAAPATPQAAPAAGGLCAKCHRLGDQGTPFGPDLAHIGTKYTKAQLLESIVEPSKSITEGYATFLLKTKSGEVFTGLLGAKTNTEVVIKDAQKEHRIPAADVQRLAASPLSSMPEGMLSDLSPQEAADLLEFLFSLK